MLLIVEGHALQSSPSIIRVVQSKNEMGRACGTYGEDVNCVQGLVWVT